MIEFLLSYGFDTLEYSWVKATIENCTLADYSVAKKHQQELGHIQICWVITSGPRYSGYMTPAVAPEPSIERVAGVVYESEFKPLVDFGVLNDNLIKGLISCGKYISRFLMKIQMFSLIHHLKYNYEVNRTM
jgi:hypothetical protein